MKNSRLGIEIARITRIARIALGSVAVAAACASAPASAHEHAPAPAAGAVIGLDAFSQGDTVDLLLEVSDPAGPRLEHLRSRDGGRTFGAAPDRVAIPGQKVFASHRGSDPRLIARGDRLLAAWTMPGTSSWGDGPLQTAVSEDGGRTWRPAGSIADDRSTEGHGFVGLSVGEDGAVHATWLDSRDGGQGVRYARSDDFGRTWGRNQDVDTRSCECCWNVIAPIAPGQVGILYRDKDPRDMALAALPAAPAASGASARPAKWERRSTVGAFGWKFQGCPHAGGALARTRDRLHALVWTGVEGRTGVYALRSDDAGKAWSEPVRLGPPTAQHLDLAANGERLVAVWDASVDGARAIQSAESRDGGRSWSAPVTLSAPGEERPTHPRALATAKGFVVLWTSEDGARPTRWRSRALP